jgi:hypothetical protein
MWRAESVKIFENFDLFLHEEFVYEWPHSESRSSQPLKTGRQRHRHQSTSTTPLADARA